MKNELVCKSELIELRGWTKALIEKFLGVPDETKVNHRYRKSAPIQLFSLDRVKTMESNSLFVEALDKSEKRRKSVRGTARDKLKEKTSLLKINLKVLDEQVLLDRALKNFNDFKMEREDYRFADKTSGKTFLDRICVNFIRHNLTSYDQDIEDLFGQQEKDYGLLLLRNKIIKEISKAYPYLREECIRQEWITPNAFKAAITPAAIVAAPKINPVVTAQNPNNLSKTESLDSICLSSNFVLQTSINLTLPLVFRTCSLVSVAALMSHSFC